MLMLMNKQLLSSRTFLVWRNVLTRPMSFQFQSIPIRQNWIRKKQTDSTVVPKNAKKSEEDGGPIEFSTSKAAEWQAKYTRRGEYYFTAPRIEGLVTLVSFCALMIYFCILREENDLDEWLDKIANSPPMTIEEAVLRSKIANDASQGKDVAALRLKLQKMVEERTQGALHS